jgi:hypothetical protein
MPSTPAMNAWLMVMLICFGIQLLVPILGVPKFLHAVGPVLFCAGMIQTLNPFAIPREQRRNRYYVMTPLVAALSSYVFYDLASERVTTLVEWVSVLAIAGSLLVGINFAAYNCFGRTQIESMEQGTNSARSSMTNEPDSNPYFPPRAQLANKSIESDR